MTGFRKVICNERVAADSRLALCRPVPEVTKPDDDAGPPKDASPRRFPGLCVDDWRTAVPRPRRGGLGGDGVLLLGLPLSAGFGLLRGPLPTGGPKLGPRCRCSALQDDTTLEARNLLLAASPLAVSPAL